MNPVIPWSKDRLLKWSDFKADPNHGVFENSSSVIEYRATWFVGSESANGRISFVIKDIGLITEFFPHRSWVREMYATSELLRHEQGHFDLVEMLRKSITIKITDALCPKMYPTKGKNEEQQKQYAREYSGMLIAGELAKIQKYVEEKRTEYDVQTDFGQDAKAQSIYDNQFVQIKI